MNLQNRRRLTDLELDLGRMLLHLKWITNEDILSSTGNSDQCYVAGWMGGEFVEEWYKWLSSFTVHMKLSQHC